MLRVGEHARSPLLVVLQSVQPLTTDVRTVGLPNVVVLTDGSPEKVVRADAPTPGRVVRLPRERWRDEVTVWARQFRVEVVTNDEFCLTALAQLRVHLGLPAVTAAGLDGYLDKVVMKSRLAAGGIQVPDWVALERIVPAELSSPPSGLHLPVVAKPRVGANSRGVRVIRDLAGWQAWTGEKSGQGGWQVESFIPGRMCFVDALVIDGEYRPVLVGSYLGGLLPSAGVDLLGAVSMPEDDPLWHHATRLGRRVAETIGMDGRFATHLEFFDRAGDLVVMEVAARAPGALVSEMARIVMGHNLETAHLAIQIGRPPPRFAPTGRQAAWISVFARPGQAYQGPPRLTSDVATHYLPTGSGSQARRVAVIGLLTNTDREQLLRDIDRCAAHAWFG
jgi:hypothetical protein